MGKSTSTRTDSLSFGPISSPPLFFPAKVAWAALGARLKRNDSTFRFGFGQHLHDFDPGTLHVVHQGVDPRRKIAVGNKRWRRDNETSSSREQTFVNSARQFGYRGITAIGSDDTEGLDHSGDGAEQTK